MKILKNKKELRLVHLGVLVLSCQYKQSQEKVFFFVPRKDFWKGNLSCLTIREIL